MRPADHGGPQPAADTPEIAEELNPAGLPSRLGGTWYPQMMTPGTGPVGSRLTASEARRSFRSPTHVDNGWPKGEADYLDLGQMHRTIPAGVKWLLDPYGATRGH